MAEFHFVQDYEKLVKRLMRKLPIDEAMSVAVGGGYETIGKIGAEVVILAGAKDGSSVLDFGCGSGRVAHFLSQRVDLKRYLGTDVVQALLNYAKTKTPKHFQFQRHTKLSIPAENDAFDVAYAFSVFTHLLQPEIYIYMQDIFRVLKPGGTFVFSFLEFSEPHHWHVFEGTIEATKNDTVPHLNMFTDRPTLKFWAERIGFEFVEFVDGTAPRWNGKGLGQAIAFVRKPA